MPNVKPILFNADMVRALLDNLKTVTRRVVKPQPLWRKTPIQQERYPQYWANWDDEKIYKAPYHPDDILYVRETWRIQRAHRYDADAHIEFKAGGDGTVLRFPHGCTDSINRKDYDHFTEKWGVGGKWHPSIHMPRKAARIYLRVTDVRVERLQDMRLADCLAEGVRLLPTEASDCIHAPLKARTRYAKVWDSTIKPADRAVYGWDANPWVWVIEFEKISKEENKNETK